MGAGVDTVAYCQRYPSARGILMDTFIPGTVGGTGRRFDWSLTRSIDTKPVILAGGLGPENVAEAISQVKPFAVDVSSSLESSPGLKDHARIAALMMAVREADDSAL